jgi:hypothetical protein
MIWGQATPLSAQAAGPANDAPLPGAPLFLPLLIGGAGSGDGGGGGGSDAGALWLPFTLADGSLLPTYGASVAVDGQGDLHVVYAIYTGTDDHGQQPATYAHFSG